MQRRLGTQSTYTALCLAIWVLCSTCLLIVQARPAPHAAAVAASVGSRQPVQEEAAITAAGTHPKAGPSASRGLGSSSSSSSNKTAYGCPRHLIYDDPWIQDNVVLTYALVLRDGLGGQVQRIMSIYAIAQALGLKYVHSPFQCIGHIGPHSHYRKGRHCNDLEPKDQQLLQRIVTYLNLPTITDADVSNWNSTLLVMGNWNNLALAVEQAKQRQEPTVIRLEMLSAFINKCPDLFHHVPSWRPYWAYQDSSQRLPVAPSSWLLDGVRPVRIAVHMRRGDLTALDDHMERRGLPASYYINIVRSIGQILDSLHHDYTVEWFTEPSTTPEGREDMARVRREVPNLAVHLDTDLLWNWHQMASADIFIMSLSAYSYVPAVVNAQGLVIRATPSKRCRGGPGGCHPSNWLEPADNVGVLSDEIIEEVHRRWGNDTAAEDHTQYWSQQQLQPQLEKQQQQPLPLPQPQQQI